MEVLQVVSLSKTRLRIDLEGKISFVLYKRELSKWQIQAGKVLSLEDYETIKIEILAKRAKKRALHLLEKVNRSESNLRQKLREGFYPSDVIEIAIEYVKSFGYLNDSAFAQGFIESRMHRKSYKEIYALLVQKGIDSEEIKKSFESFYDENAEYEAIKYLIKKKSFDKEETTGQIFNKAFNYLVRKGFSYERVRQVLQDSLGNA